MFADFLCHISSYVSCVAINRQPHEMHVTLNKTINKVKFQQCRKH